VEAIVGVKEKAKRVFGSRTHTKFEYWARNPDKGSYPCMFYLYWMDYVTLLSKF